MQSPRPDTNGFTLLELLIAISIFALLSLTAYAALDSAIKQKHMGEAQAENLRRIQTSLLYLERDLQQAVNRSSANGINLEAALEYNQLAPPTLRLTHIGWSNPLGRPRGNLQRTAYEFKDGNLYRMSWQHLDSLQGEEPQRALLLKDVEAWQMRLLDAQGQWQQAWPQRGPNGQVVAALPVVVELTLSIKGWGEIRRLIKVVGS